MNLLRTVYLWIIKHSKPDKVMYIGGSDTLPPPLEREEEAELIQRLDQGELPVRQILIERNLRLVVYIARRFENTGINIEDLISIGTIGLIKAINTFRAEKNIKLTNPQDFQRLQENARPEMRMGTGYDVHRLVEGRKLILCGVDVPHTLGLDGHSDADVAVHALMDAILGALGEGDIGRHFPDSDMKYKGISSMLLLEHVMGIVRQRGYRILNADVTIVAQKPKLAPHIPRMRANIAAAMGVDVSCANVKATTTERLGFEGEERGISAQAVALLGI